MKILCFLTLPLTFLILSFNTFAEDKSSGCGLGWMLTKKNSLLSSSLRATTNGIASNTIGMTLGTSGCAKHSIVKVDREAIYFTEANFENLLAEMGQGQGEFLNAYAHTLGCNPSQFATVTQNNYANVLANSPMDLLHNVQNLIKSSNLNCHI